jgi:hypothetical protein
MVRYFVSVVDIISYKPGEGQSLQRVLSWAHVAAVLNNATLVVICVAVIAVRSRSREYLFVLATVEIMPHFVKKIGIVSYFLFT